VGEVVSLREYVSRKIRLQRVALNEAALRDAWEREAARRSTQARWRTGRRPRLVTDAGTQQE
jgi:hypothetical protein